jgi:hypothetical protein
MFHGARERILRGAILPVRRSAQLTGMRCRHVSSLFFQAQIRLL